MDWGGNIVEGKERSLVLKRFLGAFSIVRKWREKRESVKDNRKRGFSDFM